jgi:hypothetical protein
MKVYCGRRLFVVLWLGIAVAGLSAQERPVLNDSIIQNFIKTPEAMNETFLGMEEEEDFLDFSDKMSEFQMSLVEYLSGDNIEFSEFRTVFTQVKNIRAPNMEQAFSALGLGQKGVEAFFVITLGMTIILMENRVESILSDTATDDLDSEILDKLKVIQDKLVMLRSLIHPADAAVLDKNRDLFWELMY